MCFPFRGQLGQGFTAPCLSLLLGEKIHLTGCARLFLKLWWLIGERDIL